MVEEEEEDEIFKLHAAALVYNLLLIVSDSHLWCWVDREL